MKQPNTYEAFIVGHKIGQRLSDRRYTHALALTAFNPEVFRASWRKDFPGDALNRIRYSRRIVQLGVGGRLDFGRGLSSTPLTLQEVDAQIAYLGTMSDDELIGRERTGHIASGERIIQHRISRGPVALSWHMGLANAWRALPAAQRAHPSYEIVVVDAVAKVGKPAKAAKGSDTGTPENSSAQACS